MLVTVVIPCYNVAPYVAEALDSALAQDYPELEIIVVDNGSTDGTLQVLQRYADRFPGQVRLLTEQHPGAPAARNTGWRAGRGQWIQFLDADDLLLPGKISRQMALLAGCTASSPGMVAGTPVYLHADGTVARTPRPHPDPWLGLSHGAKLGNTVVNLWWRPTLEAIGGWDETLPDSQDPYLMFASLKWNEEVVLDTEPGALCRSRLAGGQISQQNPLGRIVRQLELRLLVWEYLQTHRTAYFAQTRRMHHSLALRMLRMLAAHDLASATVWHGRLFPTAFWPVSGSSTDLSVAYCMLYVVLGFGRLEACWASTKRGLKRIGWR